MSKDDLSGPSITLRLQFVTKNSLPEDVLRIIQRTIVEDFYEPKHDVLSHLLACSRVSREWHLLFNPTIYRDVSLRRCFATRLFMNTLDSTSHGRHVRGILIWTGIYKKGEGVGTMPFTLPLKWRSRTLVHDRVIDTILRKCPDLNTISIQNRGDFAEINIQLPHVTHFPRNLLASITHLELDTARHTDIDLGHWLTRALSEGKLDCSALEVLRVRFGDRGQLGTKWTTLPKLRELIVMDIRSDAVASHRSIEALLLKATTPALASISLIRVAYETHATLPLPETLQKLQLHDCALQVQYIPLVLQSCTASLTELDLRTTYTTTEVLVWPEMTRLVRLKLTWENIAGWSVALLRTSLSSLRILEIDYTPSAIADDCGTDESTSDAVLSLLASSPPPKLESLTLTGNPSIDAHALAIAVDLLPKLHTLAIDIDTFSKATSLRHLPPNIRELELRLGSIRDAECLSTLCEDFAGGNTFASLAVLRLVDSALGYRSSDHSELEHRSESISQLLRGQLDGPRTELRVNDDREDPWTSPDWTPLKETLPTQLQIQNAAKLIVATAFKCMLYLVFLPFGMIWAIGQLAKEKPGAAVVVSVAIGLFFGLIFGLTGKGGN